MRRLVLLFVTGLVVALLPASVQAASVSPTFVAGNPTCTDLGYDIGFKPNAGGDEDAPGTFTTPYGEVSWSATRTKDDGGIIELGFTSDPPASAVVVKAAPGAFVYAYNPASSGDSGLITPNTPSGNPAGVSHLQFCYNFVPQVSKTAETSYTRTHEWDIDKVGDQTSLLLSIGQSFQVNYTVDVTKDAGHDSDHQVAGTITITNPWPVALSITSVTDNLVDAGATQITCSSTTVAANGGVVTCDYEADVADGSAGTNTATVKTKAGATAPERTTTGSRGYTFGDPTTVVDNCVSVGDDKFGALGQACETKQYQYPLTVGPYAAAGEYQFVNEACFLTDDTETEGCDDHTVTIEVPGANGCTLTQGYWKTHSRQGPAPYDAAWQNVGTGQENTLFFGSGQSWFQVFWTAPRGNAYYILAHQYMAAKLNVLDGASAPANVTAALTSAESLFGSVAGTTLTRTQTNNAKTLAATLDAFNNGLLGTPHCSE